MLDLYLFSTYNKEAMAAFDGRFHHGYLDLVSLVWNEDRFHSLIFCSVCTKQSYQLTYEPIWVV